MNSAFLLIVLLAAAGEAPKIKVGSKGYTESVILGEMAVLLAEQAGAEVVHKDNLGGTRILWSALLDGAIDVYPEYTGTLTQELFRGEKLESHEAIRARLTEKGVLMSESLGFNNSYALGVKESLAKELKLKTISDLKQHPELKFGFSSEFMKRGEGWPSLKDRYGLSPKKVTGLDHALAYLAMDSGEIGVTDIYTTDPNIKKYSLVALVDDLGHFPRYDAVFLYRRDLETRAPKVLAEWARLEGRFSDEKMLELNERVEMEHVAKKKAAADFLNRELGTSFAPRESGLVDRLAKTTYEHLLLVLVSLSAAIVVSIPLGVAAAKNRYTGQLIIGGTEIIQTIPGLALLVLLSAGFGRLGLPIIGPVPAIAALFLYSLLPIIRNTMTGLTDVPAALKESALALGLSPLARLRLIELPLASRLVLAGIKTTAVINVGYAALGGLIGAGGYGQTIKTGLDLNDVGMMMEGAIPAAVMALAVKGLFEIAERIVVPKGLRIAAAR